MATSKASKSTKRAATATKSQSRRSKTYELKTAGAISSAAKTPPAKRTQTKAKAAVKAAPVAAKKKAATTTRVKAAAPTRKAKRASAPTKAAETRRLQSYVKQISREIDQIGRKAQKAVAATEKEYNKQLRDLRRKHASVEKKLGTLIGKSDEAFHEMKKGFESAAKEVANAVTKASRQFR